jgi:hypothetical protein
VECLFLICVSEIQELPPVLIRELLLWGWYWSIRWHWSVTGENAFVEKIFRIMLDGELEIAILESVGNALLKRGHQAVYSPNFNRALDLLSWHEAQLHGRNDSKEAVSAVDQPK